MVQPELTQSQLSIIHRPTDRKVFLEGPAGTGKTTCGVERMVYLMESGIPGGTILVLIPQRTLGQSYIDVLNTPGVVAGGMVTILTIGGLARRMVDLFWPVVAREAGFSNPDRPPIFLTLETAQYYMAKIVSPFQQEKYFESITITPNRLYSQIIDNLNKAAVIGIPHTEIGERLIAAWSGEPGQVRVYQDAQECAIRFRRYCLENNLLDYSLQIEVFIKFLLRENLCKNYLITAYQHIIADNIEEDVPVAHDLLHEWIPDLQSCLLIYNQGAGYRSFLGADPTSAYTLKYKCTESFELEESFVTPPELDRFRQLIGKYLSQEVEYPDTEIAGNAVDFIYKRYFPQLLDEVANTIGDLVQNEGIPAGDIVILAPFLSDSLRFSLTNRIENLGIPTRTHRPSRSLRDEPAVQCILNLAAIAHPMWNIIPSPPDISNALLQAIEGLDPVRAYLLTQIIYHNKGGDHPLTSFDRIIPDTQERITYLIGERYEKLRLWLLEYSQQSRGELDHFVSRLFEEILSQPGYGFHQNYDAAEITANLVESIKKFRWTTARTLQDNEGSTGKEYFNMVQEGVIAAQYLESWQLRPENAVLISPAYTFLMSNYPVKVQFWLDVGNRGWAERLYQPLTHPYVLSRNWPPDSKWTDGNEIETSLIVLYRLVSGLIHRCRQKVYLGLSEFNEQGYEQRGLLLHALHRTFLELNINQEKL